MPHLDAARAYFQSRLVPKRPNAAIDPLLSAQTVTFLQQVGLPLDLDGEFQFDHELHLLPEGLVRVGWWGGSTALCLDLADHEAMIYAGDEAVGTHFLNSGVAQFTQCLYVLEHYLTVLQLTPAFGAIHGPAAGRQRAGAYLRQQLAAIDPAVLERGYYWGALLEHIEVGGL